MLATPATQRALALLVPRATGTHGDALIAWGLAIFVSELLNDEEVFLSDAGDHFRLEIPASRAALDRAVDAFTPARLRRSRLKWLACAANNRIPPLTSATDSRLTATNCATPTNSGAKPCAR